MSRHDCGRTGLEMRGTLQHERLRKERSLGVCGNERNIANFRLVEESRGIRGWRSWQISPGDVASDEKLALSP